MMRSADPLVTVGVVTSREHPPGRLPWRPGPAASGERYWLYAAVFGACAALLTLALRAGPWTRPGGLVIGPLVLVPFAWVEVLALRRWPLPGTVVVAIVVGWLTAAGTASLAPGVTLGLAMYFAASRLPRPRSIQLAVATAAVIGAGLLWAAVAGQDTPVVIEAVTGFAPLVAGWFVGDSVAARRRYLAGLARQAERERAAAAERAGQQVRAERVRIAREMHDVVAHTLAVMTVQAGVGRRLMDKRPEQASAALESIETIGRTAQDELRVVLGLLRDEGTGPESPAVGYLSGAAGRALAPAPKLAELKELAENVRASGTPVELWMSGTGRPLSPSLELSIYRVVQEALTNVVKHAPGARATVQVAVSDTGICLEVVDDGGPGGAAAIPAGPPGHGIVGMRERIGAFGGWLVAGPLADRGFRVTAEIPIEGAG
jgi:signal transduction histidine kinase